MASAAPSSGGMFSAANAASSITGIAQAASVIATTVAQISDMNKRRTIEANLALLSEKEQIALAQQIAAKQNSLDKSTILINAVEASRNAAADRAQKSKTVQWILIGAAGVAVLGILAWFLKKK